MSCCVLLYVSPALSQESVQVSTPAAASARPYNSESPLMLTFSKNRRESRVWLDYSIRWDFSDLAGFRPGLKTLVEGISALRDWDITENTRIKYYGFRTNPWRIFIDRRRPSPAGGGPGAAGQPSSAAEYGASGHRKRLRLSLSPLMDDLKKDLDKSLRSALLQNSLKSVGPEWEDTSTRNKKIFFQDLLTLDIWDLPGLDVTKEGLEYISK